MQYHGVILAACLCLLAGSGAAEGPAFSLRPPQKPQPAVTSGVVRVADETATTGTPDFEQCKQRLKDSAVSEGIRGDLASRTLAAASYDAKVIERDRNQSEFTKTIWNYLETAVSDTRIANGRAALDRHRETLLRIERRYDVDHQIVVAIWGLESAFGAFKGSNSTISALTTLACDARRAGFFEDQLIASLRILQAGDVTARDMNGSWAGAMGHTQFMPTSYLEHAVDFTGDGKRDIWGDNPADALASTAAYLKNFGWKKGQPWGVEIRLPRNFDYTLADREITRSPQDWASFGIRDMSGAPVPDHGPASILLPAGARGAAFMIFDNFAVIERYNSADAYVIGVGHLGDRILGKAAISGGWPLGDRALTFDERIALQTMLTRAGFDTKKIDGKIGPLTIAAVRAWQLANDALPDGYASLQLLDALRAAN